jgi:CheY-like chemotaxis protein
MLHRSDFFSQKPTPEFRMKFSSRQGKLEFDPLWVEQRYGARFQAFQNLMRWRIRDVLLVSSLYDLYLFEEEGRLYELIRNEYQDFYLSHSPEITRVSGGNEAIALATEEQRFDLIITTLHIEDMTALRFARLVREAGITAPIVLLAYDNSELKDLLSHHDMSVFDRMFIWQGDFRLIIAIIKHLEDRRNVAHDTSVLGVQSIILIEDSIQYYSSFLPIIYSEVHKQSQHLAMESVSISDRYLRMRARPKILLTPSYEEAWEFFDRYEECVLGLISDIDFPRGGKQHPRAGLEFVTTVRQRRPDIPILLQSTTAEFEPEARKIGTGFLLKNSPLLLHELRSFIIEHFGFGDFVFRTRDGVEVGRATDLRSLEEQLQVVPEESIIYHGERNHFSNWLKARTEFGLAHKLRPRKVPDYPSVGALREDLISSLREYRRLRQSGLLLEFSKETFIPASSFARIGGGSLGGKARGLGFVNSLLNAHNIHHRYPDVRIAVPPGVVLGTDVFDKFIDDNNLRNIALSQTEDEEILKHFLATGPFPPGVMADLRSFLALVLDPLAVRSSSLLEDSQYYPFAGVYATFMIPNNRNALEQRLQDLVVTIKRVYASTFFRAAKDYIKTTSLRLEEEKMGVIIQSMVGARHGNRYYPELAGTARSYNFYPAPPQTALDGIASLALGLGKTIADGRASVRFCPRYPRHVMQFSSPQEAATSTQTGFYALQLDAPVLPDNATEDLLVRLHPLNVAEEDGTLAIAGSTYSHENDTLTDGIGRFGTRLVTFAPVLRHNLFPLSEILDTLLQVGSWGMGTPVEIEFAVNMSTPPGAPKEFGLLQIRPLAMTHELDEMNIEDFDPAAALCWSDQVLGNGVMRDLQDIVLVDIRHFRRERSTDVAREVSQMNERMIREQRPYLLIGVGRWGSQDPWLGIPVKWEQICGARAIIEGNLKGVDITPSQGSHFFQNITSFQVGYFTVHPALKHSFIDWAWLLSCAPTEEGEFVRHLYFKRPLVVKISGQRHQGVIMKPGRE